MAAGVRRCFTALTCTSACSALMPPTYVFCRVDTCADRSDPLRSSEPAAADLSCGAASASASVENSARGRMPPHATLVVVPLDIRVATERQANARRIAMAIEAAMGLVPSCSAQPAAWDGT